jgi:hypothetical protein
MAGQIFLIMAGQIFLAGTDPTGYVIDTVWDVGNVIFDAGKIVVGVVTGDSNMVQEAVTDIIVDAAATLIPFVPAGASKVARAGADKVADVRQASKKSDATPAAQKTEGSSNTDGGSKGNGAEPSQSANSSKPDSTADIGSQAENAKTYQTYTKSKSETGEVYTGRTSGKGTPEENIAKRDQNHHKSAEGFGPAKLDKSSPNKDAIRGREQQSIDQNGGSKSQGGTSGNGINGISEKNPKKDQYMDAARKEFDK